jgi:hypothetical protein
VVSQQTWSVSKMPGTWMKRATLMSSKRICEVNLLCRHAARKKPMSTRLPDDVRCMGQDCQDLMWRMAFSLRCPKKQSQRWLGNRRTKSGWMEISSKIIIKLRIFQQVMFDYWVVRPRRCWSQPWQPWL